MKEIANKKNTFNEITFNRKEHHIKKNVLS